MAENGQQRILVVDDESSLARLIQMVMEYQGYVVDWAADGEEALALGRRHEYAAVICDILMPILDGVELYQIWQANAPQLAQRVIFVTGGNLGSRTDRFIHLCGRPCLYKPFDMRELASTIQEVAGVYAS